MTQLRAPSAGSEAALWGQVRTRLAPYGELGRVENGVEPGWPDVAYALRVPARPPSAGWLELKHLSAWPVRPRDRVNLTSLTLEQVRWALRWRHAGARVHALLQVGRDYLLLDPCALAALYRRELDRAALLASALVVGTGRFPTRDLVRCLTLPA
jgi:hypothetical protein